ncbi:hypothetical protein K1Y77_12650 [Halomonas qaidamensis]|uniref:Uncharacterized protein n=1 Tax=Halomonas qaidamensis TaxID=2866211 RepID=A0ABY6JM24_9GAMM|nr:MULTISPECIES: hypothetical protein [Halomonas]UYV18326.1 hypothetical protein K1Y77_12650 [Halomonas qaidamensis]
MMNSPKSGFQLALLVAVASLIQDSFSCELDDERRGAVLLVDAFFVTSCS